MAVTTKFKDGAVRLMLDGTIKAEQPEIGGVNIGTYTDYEDEEVEKCDYNAAYVGKDASFTRSRCLPTVLSRSTRAAGSPMSTSTAVL